MITEIVEKVMRNGIISFAEQSSVRIGHSQLMIFCKEDTAVPCYKSLIYEKPSREVSFNEILGVKVDLLNREGIAGPFIQNALLRYSKEYNISPPHIHIVVFVNEINKSVNLHLYNGATSIKPITLDEVLNQPKQ
jgi:hypothetical protein